MQSCCCQRHGRVRSDQLRVQHLCCLQSALAVMTVTQAHTCQVARLTAGRHALVAESCWHQGLHALDAAAQADVRRTHCIPRWQMRLVEHGEFVDCTRRCLVQLSMWHLLFIANAASSNEMPAGTSGLPTQTISMRVRLSPAATEPAAMPAAACSCPCDPPNLNDVNNCVLCTSCDSPEMPRIGVEWLDLSAI